VIVARYGDRALPAFLVLTAALMALVVIDLGSHRLPNRIVYPTTLVMFALLTMAAAFGDSWPTLGRATLAGVVAFVAMAVVALVSPSGIGLGDVKLSFVIGLALGWLGWNQLLGGFLIAFMISAAVALALVASRRLTRKDAMAFGPFLALGTLVMLIVG
jgi:leader peptidase (prepilin peptidase)/N-methyltransferase